MKIAVRNKEGKEVKKLDLKPEIFESDINQTVVHQVVRSQMAAARSGTASTKTRAEVSGGGKKPWRQKGTGRARAGSNRSPLWVGGGVVFGPKPRDYAFPVPKKMRRLALKSVLSLKAKSDDLVVVDDFGLTEPRTKEAAVVLKNLGVTGKATVVVADGQEVVEKSCRNIPGVHVVKMTQLNVYDLVNNEKLVLTKSALDKIEEALA